MGHRFDHVVVHLVKANRKLFCHQDREQITYVPIGEKGNEYISD